MLFEQRLQSVKLSVNEREIADFILQQRENIRHMTTRDIARLTYTSPSAVIRLSKKMNYDGFEALKFDFLQEIKYIQEHFQNIDSNIPFQQHHSLMDIAAINTSLMKESADDTFSLIHHDDLQKAVLLLNQAEKIYLFGIENNQYLLELFKYNMVRINKQIIHERHFGNQIYTALQSTHKDCALIVSYSGESKSLLQAADYLKQRKCPVITITSIGDNQLSRFSSCTLYMSTREKLNSKIAPFSTEYSLFLILNMLYSGVFSREYEKNFALKINRTQELENSRFSSSKILQEE